MQEVQITQSPWVWSIVGKRGKFFGVLFGEVIAVDPRDALSRALTSAAGKDSLVAEVCNVPVEVLDEAPCNGDTSLDIELEHLTIKLRKCSLSSFDPPAPWQPAYSKWRHGGWYTTVRYLNGACGCVSRNYPDRKWRIVCDQRRRHDELGQPGDFTYPSIDAAARAEYALAKMEEAGLYQSVY
ncbi:hypothetical protein [Ralstonia pseudosolanacearum]|uniref:hypothetical protein n=1 Tax=Ralstonia pseudosolanacearum TaxID=1310165 RepID=UPI003CEDFC66